MGNSIYLPKAQTEKDSAEGYGAKGRFKFGVSAMQGWRRAMEDAHVHQPDFTEEFGLFCVFDGHGGQAVATLCAEKLPEILKNEPAWAKGDYKLALQDAFKTMDRWLGSNEGRAAVQDVAQRNGDDEGEDEEPNAFMQQMLQNPNFQSILQKYQDHEEEDEEDSDDLDVDEEELFAQLKNAQLKNDSNHLPPKDSSEQSDQLVHHSTSSSSSSSSKLKKTSGAAVSSSSADIFVEGGADVDAAQLQIDEVVKESSSPGKRLLEIKEGEHGAADGTEEPTPAAAAATPSPGIAVQLAGPPVKMDATVSENEEKQEKDAEDGTPPEEQNSEDSKSPKESSAKQVEEEVVPDGTSPEEQNSENSETPKESDAAPGKKPKSNLIDDEKGGEEDSDDDSSSEEDETDAFGTQMGAEDLFGGRPSPDTMGCTANVCLIQADKETGKPIRVYCANAGDSRSVLCRRARDVPLSFDHKPTDEGERRRIENAGGTVNEEGRIDNNLNLSRALGDLFYKQRPHLEPEDQKISGVPDVQVVELTDDDNYIVMGCDGIFEKQTNESLVEWINDKFQKGATSLSKICEQFLDFNVAPSPGAEMGLGCDNMSIMIIRPSATSPLPSGSTKYDIDNGAVTTTRDEEEQNSSDMESPVVRSPPADEGSCSDKRSSDAVDVAMPAAGAADATADADASAEAPPSRKKIVGSNEEAVTNLESEAVESKKRPSASEVDVIPASGCSENSAQKEQAVETLQRNAADEREKAEEDGKEKAEKAAEGEENKAEDEPATKKAKMAEDDPK